MLIFFIYFACSVAISLPRKVTPFWRITESGVQATEEEALLTIACMRPSSSWALQWLHQNDWERWLKHWSLSLFPRASESANLRQRGTFHVFNKLLSDTLLAWGHALKTSNYSTHWGQSIHRDIWDPNSRYFWMFHLFVFSVILLLLQTFSGCRLLMEEFCKSSKHYLSLSLGGIANSKQGGSRAPPTPPAVFMIIMIISIVP